MIIWINRRVVAFAFMFLIIRIVRELTIHQNLFFILYGTNILHLGSAASISNLGLIFMNHYLVHKKCFKLVMHKWKRKIVLKDLTYNDQFEIQCSYIIWIFPNWNECKRVYFPSMFNQSQKSAKSLN